MILYLAFIAGIAAGAIVPDRWLASAACRQGMVEAGKGTPMSEPSASSVCHDHRRKEICNGWTLRSPALIDQLRAAIAKATPTNGGDK